MPIKSYSDSIKETNGVFRTGAFSAQQEAVSQQMATEDDLAPTSFWQGTQAMFQEENWLTSSIMSETLPFAFDKYDPSYYPYDDIEGLQDVPGHEMLYEAKSKDHMAALKQRLDRSIENDKLIARMPTGQRIVAGLAAGVLGPEIFIPGMVIIKGAKSGISIAKSGLASAAAGAGSVAISEAGLRLSQPDRTGQEAVMNIGFGAVLGGLLGSGASYLSKAKFDKMAANLKNDLGPIADDVDIDVVGEANPMSISAAEAPKFSAEDLEIQGRAAQVYNQIKSKIPVFRASFNTIMESPFTSAKEIYVKLMEIPVPLKVAARKEMPVSAETERMLFKQRSAKWLKDSRALYREYKKVEKQSGNKPMTIDAFYKNVDYATRNGDVFEGNEFIEQSAKKLRELYDYGLTEAQSVKLFGDDVEAKFAESYGHRIWKKKALIQRRDEAMKIFKRWAEKKTKLYLDDLDAKITSLASKAKKLTEKQADQLAELRLEKRIISEDSTYVDDVAQQVYDTLIDQGSPNAGLFHKTPAELRGPLREKLLDIEDNEVLDFIETRADVVATRYAEKIGAEVSIARALGDTPDMKMSLKKLDDEYTKMAKGLSGKEAQKLNDQYRQIKTQLQDLRDLLRGNYRHSLDPESLAARAHTIARDWVYSTTLGEVTVSSLPDAARTIMVHGIERSFGDIISGFDSSLSKIVKEMDKAEAQALGFDLEEVLGSTLMTRSDVADPMARGTYATRVSGVMTDVFSKTTLIDKWNNLMKNFAMRVTQSRILKGIGEGTDNEYLNFLGLSNSVRKTIAEQVEKHGRIAGSRRYSGADKWDTNNPAVREALRVYSAALRKEANTIVVTRSLGDVPMWTHTPAGKLIFLLKTFTWAADQRVLMRALSDANASSVYGAVTMVGIGMMIGELRGETYALSREIGGLEPVDREKNLQSKILDGIDRSGILPMIMYANNLWGATGMPNIETAIGAETPSRYANERRLLSAVAGPLVSNSWDTLLGIGGVGGAALSDEKEITNSDLKRLQRAIPFNNVAVLRFGFDSLRGKIAEGLDVE